jgi:hypothetical protein
MNFIFCLLFPNLTARGCGRQRRNAAVLLRCATHMADCGLSGMRTPTAFAWRRHPEWCYKGHCNIQCELPSGNLNACRGSERGAAF